MRFHLISAGLFCIATIFYVTDAVKCFVSGPMNDLATPNFTIDCGMYQCSLTYSYTLQTVQRSCHPQHVCNVNVYAFSNFYKSLRQLIEQSVRRDYQ